VGSAYRFFQAQLVAADDPDDLSDITRIEDAVMSGLALVSVAAQQGDNAHRIFESLNNTGLQLTQGDLLRNYLFMRLPTRGEAAYQSLWMPLQSQLGSADLELLFWLDLVQRDPRVKQTDTYAAQQARLDRLTTEAEVEAELARFARLGRLLQAILHPTDEPDPLVRRRLERLNAWGTTTVYPLLLHLLDRRDQGSATSEQIAAAMLNESFQGSVKVAIRPIRPRPRVTSPALHGGVDPGRRAESSLRHTWTFGAYLDFDGALGELLCPTSADWTGDQEPQPYPARRRHRNEPGAARR
jgi:hypothetical protein